MLNQIVKFLSVGRVLVSFDSVPLAEDKQCHITKNFWMSLKTSQVKIGNHRNVNVSYGLDSRVYFYFFLMSRVLESMIV